MGSILWVKQTEYTIDLSEERMEMNKWYELSSSIGYQSAAFTCCAEISKNDKQAWKEQLFDLTSA